MDSREIRTWNGLFRIASPDLEKPRELSPQEKIAADRHKRLIADKAMSRQIECWCYLCQKPATIWVAEVCFDFKGDKAEPVRHAQISSGDFDGPVPGFCHFCLGTGPSELAEAVYFSKTEIQLGVTPTRWFVVFTDGTKQGGSCVELNNMRGLPTINHG